MLGLGLKKTIYHLLKLKDYQDISLRFLIFNYCLQRIIGINGRIKFPVHFTSRVIGGSKMKLGIGVKKCFLTANCANIVVFNGTTLEIGDNTIFANNFCIRTGNHGLMNRDEYYLASIKIGKNCWFGHGVTLLPGVMIGNNVTIGANSVVTKSFGDNLVIAGNPAKVIRELD